MANKEKHVTLDDLCRTVQSYFPEAQIDRIKKAYAFADNAHKGQLRSSGDPYIIHPLEVAYTLAEMKMDIASIITALLHDTVEDTDVSSADITKEFGADVAALVDGVTKLSQITFRTTEEKQAENFRKMIIAMAKDIRVILVKLADRLNNMRTLDFLPEEKQRIIAQETLDIYAPIANRLGMGWIKIELEDLCLRHLHRDAYVRLTERISKKKKERDAYIESLCVTFNEKLKEYDMNAQVSGRAKHFYSIYKKIERRSVDFDQINDIIAFRIIVDNITECYKALGVIHALFLPVPGRFKDYIAMPKANNYQSLHTTVIGPEGERVEIQIRTQEMHQVAERGIAAHWQYKEGKFESKSRENTEWVTRLLEWQKDLSDPNEFLETVKIDLFAEDVFIFTPTGEVKQLPFGSTPLDFAFAVHTDVGNKCVGAKVNGKQVPLKHRLKSGDTVEIITSPNQQPSKDWLKIVKSSRAKAKIRAFIKTQERDRAMEIGTELVDKELKKYELSPSKIEKSGQLIKVAQDLSLRTVEELRVSVGYGRVSLSDIISRLLTKEEIDKRLVALHQPETPKPEVGFLKKMFKHATKPRESKTAIKVANLNDVLIRFAKCCNPLPGDSIVGFITRGRGVTIHSGNCPKAIDTDQERKIDVQWNIHPNSQFRHQVRIRILSTDEPGLLAMLSQTISHSNINITSANVRVTKDKKAVAIFEVEVTDLSQLHKVMSALEAKKGVISVERTRN
ncbi:MAG: bifunctional (p)ppGpp synthetase/guanosine-3',5'-bis(diphosphate) 3'-pyrophosphohydrolase [Xanthomonadaceae bacterium]|nr:bifunctional (p)ppGpp synthetase/guanosine-3',5'-bis(diphosphate) 3'-pyrophosphohydrolase [Xanthomonadaceae bacterium]